jgi:hypothetical protein
LLNRKPLNSASAITSTRQWCAGTGEYTSALQDHTTAEDVSTSSAADSLNACVAKYRKWNDAYTALRIEEDRLMSEEMAAFEAYC